MCNKLKVVYIAKANIPSTSANSVHVMKISEAFSKLCAEFSLIIPRPQSGEEDVEKSFNYYGVNYFDIKTVRWGKNNIINRYIFPMKCMWKARKADRIITRDPIVAFLGVLLHKHTVLDLHGDLRHLCGRAYRMLYWRGFRDSKYLHMVMITNGLVDYYHEKYKINKKNITVLADGYTAENFDNVKSRELFSGEIMNIGYCGGFLTGKGMKIVHQLTQRDSLNRYNLYGGTKEKAAEEVRGVFGDNVYFGGYIPNVKVPEILNEQDILLLPNQNQQVCKNEDIGKVTSPLKMFEYMASGRVIVASDLKVLREILDETNCYFAVPDDVESWKAVIKHIEENKEEAIAKAKKAKEDVKKYTWAIRAEKMLGLVREHN